MSTPILQPEAVKQRTLLAEVAQQLDAADARATALAGDLTTRQLAWPPPGGGWGVGQVLEHLAVAADSYLPRLRALVERGAPRRASSDALWRPSIGGRLLASVVRPDSRRRFPAPAIYRVTSTPRPDALAAFLRTQDELRDVLQRAGTLDLNRLRLASPVTWLLRMNAGDAMLIATLHAQRHLAQIERIRARPDFPANDEAVGRAQS